MIKWRFAYPPEVPRRLEEVKPSDILPAETNASTITAAVEGTAFVVGRDVIAYATRPKLKSSITLDSNCH